MEAERIFKNIISGRSVGPVAEAARGVLHALSGLYAAGVRRRNASFDAQTGVSHAKHPVISIGNITAGGTGKTPTVRYVCECLAKTGRRPAVLTRGYGAEKNAKSFFVSEAGRILVGPAASGDEAWLLSKQMPFADVVVGRKRAESAALAETHADVFVLDDGFQHRALARDLDIVLIDATNPFGYEYVLPRGLLREPLESLQRADIVVLTRTDRVTPEGLNQTKDALRDMLPHVPIYETVHETRGIQTIERWLAGEAPDPVQSCKGVKLLAVSGIATPQSFIDNLTAAGLTVHAEKAYGDHHAYGEDDLIDLLKEAFFSGAEAVVTTEKDAVKMAPLLEDSDLKIPVFVLPVGIRFTGDEAGFCERLIEAVRGSAI